MVKVRYNKPRDDDIWIAAKNSTYRLKRRGKDRSSNALGVIDIDYLNTAAGSGAFGEIDAADANITTETGVAVTSATGTDVGVINLFCISGGEYAVKQATLVGTGEASLGTNIPIHAWMNATPASGNVIIHLSGVTGTTYLSITGGAVDSNGARIPIPSNYRASVDSWSMKQMTIGTVATDEQLGWLDIRNYETGGAALTVDNQYGLTNLTNGYSPYNIVKGEVVYKNQETIIPKSKAVTTAIETKNKIRINVWKKDPNT